MRKSLALLALIAWPAMAQATAWTATYEFHAAGLRVLEAQITFDVDGPEYRLEAHSRSRGLLGFFAHSEQVTTITGRWAGGMPRPRQYRVQGQYRGERRVVEMDYGADGTPRVGALVPSAIDDSREPVPAERLPGTLDALSAVARLSRIVAETGRCDTAATMFDARRLTQVNVRTIGQEAAPNARGAGLQALVLRCELESRVLAGFRTDQDRARAAQPIVTTAWIGRPVEGAPPVPLRLELATRWWGTTAGVLTRMERAAP